MDVYEALYTTRMMRRLRPDPIPLDTQARILDAAVRAPNGGNTQRWHFVAVDDPKVIREVGELFRRARALEYEKFRAGTGPMVAPAPGADPVAHAETMRRMKGSGDYLADHFDEVPLLLFVFAIDDLGGANIYPAIWRPRRCAGLRFRTTRAMDCRRPRSPVISRAFAKARPTRAIC